MRRTLCIAIVLCGLLAPATTFAKARSYQVTGPIIELTDDLIVIEKGATKKERFEIVRTKDTKVEGELKVGEKVTVHYTMSADSIESKGETKKEEKPADKKE